jgi:hypothetical protein
MTPVKIVGNLLELPSTKPPVTFVANVPPPAATPLNVPPPAAQRHSAAFEASVLGELKSMRPVRAWDFSVERDNHGRIVRMQAREAE